MKKIIIPVLLLLAACNTTRFVAYTGDAYVIGHGGFYNFSISSDMAGIGKEYSDTRVDFFTSGLPNNTKCRYLGYGSNPESRRLAKTIIEIGGNVATGSSISMLGGTSSGYSASAISITDYQKDREGIKGYNFFDCGDL